ncbi:MAG: hypothetical protein JSU66_15690, partial [Deltaproteobacteria bacterium]
VAHGRSWRPWVGWLLLGLLAAYTGFVHHGFGPAPQVLHPAWYHPGSFMIYYLQANTPVDPVEARALTTLLVMLPSLVLGVAAGVTLRSAVGRVVALALVLAGFCFLFIGLRPAAAAWRLYEWRYSALMLSISITVAAGLLAPLLAASWLRRGIPVRLALYLPIFALAVVLMRNATGFDTSAPLNLSLWPTLPFFGLQVVDAYLATAWCFVALILAGVATRHAGPLAWGLAAGGAGILAIGLVTLGGTGWAPACVLGVASALAIAAARRAPQAGARALRFGVGAHLIALPLLVGQGLVELDYAETQDRRAQAIIDALSAYYAKHTVYPASLQELVDQGYLEAVPRPAIGFRWLSTQAFAYEGFGDNYLLEFAAPGWVQCQYNPPWIDDFAEEEDLGEAEAGGVWQCPPPRPPDFF